MHTPCSRRRRTRRGLARLVAPCGALLAVGALAGAAVAGTYEITIDNLVPGGMATGNPLTPPVAVIANAAYQLFALGTTASPGLKRLAEEGDGSVLVTEAHANPNVYRTAVGSGPFFTSVTFMVDGFPGDRCSVVMMFGRSNDLITGIQGVAPPVSRAWWPAGPKRPSECTAPSRSPMSPHAPVSAAATRC